MNNENNKITAVELKGESWKQTLNTVDYSIFNTFEWIQSISDEKTTPIYIDFIDENRNLIGKISGIVLRKKGKQLYFYSGIALSNNNETVYDNCLNALHKFARKNRFSRIEIKNYDTYFTSTLKNKNFFQSQGVEYSIFLEEEIIINKDFKSKLKKAGKEPITFEELKYDSETEEKFSSLMNNTMLHRINKKHDEYDTLYILNLTNRALKKLSDCGLGRFFAIKSSEGIHCIHFHLEKGNRAYSLLLGCDGYTYRKGLRAHLDSKLTESFKSNGFKYYNLGGIPLGRDGEGLRSYKKSAGAIPAQAFGAYTHFLVFPYSLLNPVYSAGKFILKHKNKFFKK